MHRQQVDQAHRDHDRADAERQRDHRGGNRTEDREQDDQDDRQVPLFGVGDVVFGVRRRGGAERTLPDDIEPHVAVAGLPGLITVDAHLLAELLGDVAGVARVQPQRHHIRPVRLRRPLGLVGHLGYAGDLAGDASQLRGRGVDVLVAGVRARGRDQRQRPVVAVLRFELIVDPQRLRSGHFEAAAGEIPRLRHRQIDRRHQREQPACEDHPAESAQAAA